MGKKKLIKKVMKMFKKYGSEQLELNVELLDLIVNNRECIDTLEGRITRLEGSEKE